MQLGRNSICHKVTVNKTSVKVQLDKNLSICDIEPRIGDMLSEFRGRQFYDPYVREHFENVLKENIG